MDKYIWVVDDDESIRWVLEKGLQDSGMDVQTFDSANKVIKKLETENPKLIITDIRMPGPSGIDLLDKVKELRPEIPVIIMTAHSDLDSALNLTNTVHGNIFLSHLILKKQYPWFKEPLP